MAPRYRGQGRDSQVAPILILRMRRDAPCERPCTLCERGCELHGSPRASPCSGGAGLASARGLAGGFSEAGLLLCATEGAGEEQADRAGAPVGASTAWDSDCGLSDENGIICESAGGACLLCIWSCATPSGLPGPVGADSGAAAESVLSYMAVAWLSLSARGDAD